LLVYSPIQS